LELSIPTPADVSVSTAKIVNNAVDETKLKDALVADFTEVVVAVGDSFLLGDSSDSGNTKRDTIQGLLDLAGGAWTLIGTQTASSSSSLAQTGVTGYDTFAIVINDLRPGNDGVFLNLQVGDSSGLDSGASDYDFHIHIMTSGTSTYQGVVDAAHSGIRLGAAVGLAAGEAINGVHFLGSSVTQQPTLHGTSNAVDDTAKSYSSVGGGRRLAVITLDRISIAFSAGVITSGRLSVYGIAHS
jgi:hypothetical protein